MPLYDAQRHTVLSPLLPAIATHSLNVYLIQNYDHLVCGGLYVASGYGLDPELNSCIHIIKGGCLKLQGS